MPTSSTSWTSSTTITESVFAATTTDDPAGLPPSRLMTPYWRSKPVEIASETIAAAMTARLIDPGRRRSTGSPVAVPPDVSNALNTSSTPAGMTNVMRRPSPRRRTSRNSYAASASAIAGHDAGRAGTPGPDREPARTRCRSRSRVPLRLGGDVRADELEIALLEAGGPEPQLRQRARRGRRTRSPAPRRRAGRGRGRGPRARRRPSVPAGVTRAPVPSPAGHHRRQRGGLAPRRGRATAGTGRAARRRP